MREHARRIEEVALEKRESPLAGERCHDACHVVTHLRIQRIERNVAGPVRAGHHKLALLVTKQPVRMRREELGLALAHEGRNPDARHEPALTSGSSHGGKAMRELLGIRVEPVAHTCVAVIHLEGWAARTQVVVLKAVRKRIQVVQQALLRYVRVVPVPAGITHKRRAGRSSDATERKPARSCLINVLCANHGKTQKAALLASLYGNGWRLLAHKERLCRQVFANERHARILAKRAHQGNLTIPPQVAIGKAMLVTGPLVRLHKAVVARGVKHPVAYGHARHAEVAHAVARTALHGVCPGVVAVQVERRCLTQRCGKRCLHSVDHNLTPGLHAQLPALALAHERDTKRDHVRTRHQARRLYVDNAPLVRRHVPAHTEGRFAEKRRHALSPPLASPEAPPIVPRTRRSL